MLGYFIFSDGRRGWCRPILDDRAVQIDFYNGGMTVLPKDHEYLVGVRQCHAI